MRILVVDDDRGFRESLVHVLGDLPHEITACAEARAALARIEGVDLLLTDVRMPGMSGIDLLGEARRLRPGIEVIVMTGHATIDLAVRATREGARAFLEKPFEVDDLAVHLREVEKVVRLRDAAGRGGRGRLVGSSPEMRRVYDAIDIAASSDATVLITGATGTGKEAAAEAIHGASSRAAGPFLSVNVGAIPRDLAESELFGAFPGAYTGIRDRRLGRFELARGGVLFLDEINSLSQELQPKLLRAIETREIWPLGAQKAVACDARIIAASNERIEDLVKAGRFREDLYYRLHVLTVRMPELRERPADIPAIAESLLESMAARGARIALTGEALAALMSQSWPGNVRELRNVLERALARRGADPGALGRVALTPDDLGLEGGARFELPYREGRLRAADEWSRRAIRAALAETSGNISAASRLLRMSRTSLMALLRKFDLRR